MKRSIKYTLLGAAVLGTVLITAAAADNTFGLGKNIEILVNMFRNINMFYVDDVDPDKLMDDAAEGMTKNLDPYTDYISPKNADTFATLTSGKYGGVGSLIRKSGDWVEFTAPYKNSPADRAGIRPGDRIIEIDGKDAKGYATDKVSSLLKGDPGTTIRIKVRKFPSDQEVELKLKREIINIPGVPYYGMVADSIGYIKHSDFSEGCSNDILAAYRSLKAAGAKSLILDLRGNGGGILQEAVKILSMFVPKGSEVVSTRSSKSGKVVVFKTENEPVDTSIPIVVLTNSGTASSAEIVAGALQDMDRAVLIGQRTFGKGLVQSTYPLGSGAYVKITTAKYYLPSGRCIQAIDYEHRNDDGSVGIVPDSLIKEFRTAVGRKVYDGGGIMPDVVMPAEYVSSFAYVVYGTGHIDNFISEYCRKHYNTLAVAPRSYRFTDKDYDEFMDYMKDKTVAWESEASYYWKQFKEAAAKERWSGNMDSAMADIEKNLTSDTKANLILYKKELSDIIENQIVARYCYNSGAVEHSLRDDNELAEAVKLLSDGQLYHKTVTSQDTSRK